ncbi:MAG: ribosome maturation factor RimM [Gammaproteobacteria bacterium]|nr:ribosome maturation factor RimM [Gammaproteobacteria bacterium]
MAADTDEPVLLGRINGLHGVRGWVKVYSFTEPRENILNYRPWLVRIQGQWREISLKQGRRQGKGVVAQLEGYSDRDEAAALIGSDIAITRDQMPPAAKDEYYWADLVGCMVVTVDGVELGQVDGLFETGANDVMVVKGERERLLPFIQTDVIKQVDLDEKRIEVDWDPEF